MGAQNTVPTAANEVVALPFQSRVQPWLVACFGEQIAIDKVERNHRFFEEATETVQAGGMTASEAYQLVDYVFGRPVGELAQEVGGTMNTLAALCLAHGLDMHEAAEVELTRVWTKIEKIRAKQKAKPKHSPLPEGRPTPPPSSDGDARTDALCDLSYRAGLQAGWKLGAANDRERYNAALEARTGALGVVVGTRPEAVPATTDAVRAALEAAGIDVKRDRAAILTVVNPDGFWDWENPEDGYQNENDILAEADMLVPVRMQAAYAGASIWGVRAPIYGPEGDLDGDDVQWFSTEAEAQAFCADAKASATGDAA